jgi:ribosome biogenesis GTPase
MEDQVIWGQVMRLLSGFYTIQTSQGSLICRLRGRLKQGAHSSDLVALGDRVKVLRLADGSGIIEEIEPRTHALIRKAPTARGEYQQVLLANPDQVVFVFSCANPEPHLRMLDRFLVIAEQQRIPALIVANKIDLVGLEAARKKFDLYTPLEYPLHYTSAKSGMGIDGLRDQLAGKLSALAGPSGVGKSSLLNAIQPELGLAVREVSKATSKGRHTTVIRQLFPLDVGGFVADLPGMRMLSLWDIEPEELDGYFPELRDLVQHCQFNDCKHLNEPDCAVQAAVARGEVAPERYDSYLRLRFGEEE